MSCPAKTRDKRINEVTVDKAVDDLLDYPATELINFLVSDKIGKNMNDALIEEGDLDNILKAMGESPLSYA